MNRIKNQPALKYVLLLKTKNIVKLLPLLSFSVLILGTQHQAHGQGSQPSLMPQVIPASPQSSALAKYINYPVSYSTGIPEISIPLYEIKVGDIMVPITLSYHSSGLKVNEQISWVGSGWNLSAEPVVTRSIQGRADESPVGYINSVQPAFSSSWTSYLDNLEKGLYDEQPDEFYYRLSDQSGGFFFSKVLKGAVGTHSIKTHPFRPLDIKFLENSRFEITDEKGIRYRFGKALDGTIYNERTFGGLAAGNTSAWKGTEIISSSRRDTVFFKYHSKHTEYHGRIVDHVNVEDSASTAINPMEYFTGCLNVPLPAIREYSGGMGNMLKVDINGNFTNSICDYYPPSEVFSVDVLTLQEIRFPGGKVVFQKTANRQLASITVYEGDQPIRTISLFQGNFPVSFSSNLRPKLDSIQIKDKIGRVTERYGFGYNIDSLETLPDRYLGKQMDFWGYYNGPVLEYHTSIVPFTSLSSPNQYLFPLSTSKIYFNIGSTNRIASAIYAAKGMLSSITYPGGGRTTFQYEGNQYSDPVSVKNGPGIRIAKMSHFDPLIGKQIQTVFRYGKNGNGVGFIKRQLSLDQYLVEHQNYYYNGFSGLLEAITRSRTYSADLHDDLFYSSGGAPVVYNHVAVYQVDGVDTLGKTEYIYNYQDNSYSISHRVPKTPLIMDAKFDWERGQLMSESVFKRNGDNYGLIKRVGYGYGDPVPVSKVPVGKVFRRVHVARAPSGFTHVVTSDDFSHVEYEIRTGVKLVSSDTTVIYEGATPVSVINLYSYNSENLLPVTIQSKRSDGNNILITNSYPPNPSETDPVGETGRFRLLSDHRLSTLLRQKTTENGISRTEWTNYGVVNGIAQKSSAHLKLGSGTPQALVSYISYDGRGNIAAVAADGGPATGYLWDYNGQQPVAAAKNAVLSDIAYAGFEADGKGNWTYTGATIADETAPTGKRVYRLNGTATNLQKTGLSSTRSYLLTYWAKSASATGISGGTAVAVRSKGEWTQYRRVFTSATAVTITGTGNLPIDDVRLHPLEATMDSYTYDPLIGMTSHTDASGSVFYYLYDDFGRMKEIKDLNGHVVEDYRYNYRTN